MESGAAPNAAFEALVGRDLGEVTIVVERGKIAELAHAWFDDDPIYRDGSAAVDAGFSDVPVPSIVTVAVDHWAPRDLTSIIADDLGFDVRRTVHGEVGWEVFAQIVPGAELIVRRRVAAVDSRVGRRSGVMRFATLESEMLTPAGTLVARRHDTIIEQAA